MPGGRAAGDEIAAVLARWIGPDAARAVVRTFSDRVLGCRPDEIAPDGAERLVEALRPMLRALLGQTCVEPVVSELKSACAPTAAPDRTELVAPSAAQPDRCRE